MAEAYATLSRGAAFLAGEVGPTFFSLAACVSSSPGERYRAKAIGNALRELDRFLNVLADEVSRVLSLPVSEGQQNTANKLRELDGLNLSDGDRLRLRALGRSRECLFHLDGRVAAGDRRGGSTFTAGWPALEGHDRRLRLVTVGDYLVVSDADLRDIAEFYRHLARRLCRLA